MFNAIRRTKQEQLEGVGDYVSAKKVAHNTIERTLADGTRIVRLHLTDIVTTYPDGRVKLNSGGFLTHTTKDRLTGYLPAGWSLWTDRGIWYLGRRSDGKRFVFADGVTFSPDGIEVMGIEADEEARLQDLNKKIAAYCKALRGLHNLPKPESGDCWFCCMQTADGKSFGEATRDDHLHSHMEEGYFVGSLIVRAMRAAGCSDFAIAYAYQNHGRGYDRATRAVRRYLRSQLGLGN